MSALIAKLRCKFGLHFWEQNRPLKIIDGWPTDPIHQNPTRKCIRCDKLQEWLPGYGGSEWGCWSRPSPAAIRRDQT